MATKAAERARCRNCNPPHNDLCESCKSERSVCEQCEQLFHHRDTDAHARFDYCSKICEDRAGAIRSMEGL